MGEAKTKKLYSEETLEQDILNDIQEEARFLVLLGKHRPEKIKTELEIMVDVLNEQTEQLSRHRFDLGTWLILIDREPWNDEWKEKKQETLRILRGRKATVEAVRDQILMKLGKKEVK